MGALSRHETTLVLGNCTHGFNSVGESWKGASTRVEHMTDFAGDPLRC